MPALMATNQRSAITPVETARSQINGSGAQPETRTHNLSIRNGMSIPLTMWLRIDGIATFVRSNRNADQSNEKWLPSAFIPQYR